MANEEISELTVEEPKELPLVDEGDYAAPVSNVQTNIEGKFGLSVRIFFEIAGQEIPAIASQALNQNTKLYGWAEAILGRKLAVGEKLKFSDLIGKTAMVTVRSRDVKDKDGKVRIGEDGAKVLTSVVKEVRANLSKVVKKK